MPTGVNFSWIRSESAINDHLTVEPEATFFKTTYKRHTPFAWEDIALNPVSGKGVKWAQKGVRFSVTPDRDLVGQMYLYLNLEKMKYGVFNDWDSGDQDVLKALPSEIIPSEPLEGLEFLHHDELKPVFIDYLGYCAVEKAQVKIGNYVLEELTGDFMQIWDSLTRHTQRSYVKNVPSGHGGLHNPGIKHDQHIYIPLQFYFNRDISNYLPIKAITYANITVEVDLSPKPMRADALSFKNANKPPPNAAGIVVNDAVNTSNSLNGYRNQLKTLSNAYKHTISEVYKEARLVNDVINNAPDIELHVVYNVKSTRTGPHQIDTPAQLTTIVATLQTPGGTVLKSWDNGSHSGYGVDSTISNFPKHGQIYEDRQYLPLNIFHPDTWETNRKNVTPKHWVDKQVTGGTQLKTRDGADLTGITETQNGDSTTAKMGLTKKDIAYNVAGNVLTNASGGYMATDNPEKYNNKLETTETFLPLLPGQSITYYFFVEYDVSEINNKSHNSTTSYQVILETNIKPSGHFHADKTKFALNKAMDPEYNTGPDRGLFSTQTHFDNITLDAPYRFPRLDDVVTKSNSVINTTKTDLSIVDKTIVKTSEDSCDIAEWLTDQTTYSTDGNFFNPGIQGVDNRVDFFKIPGTYDNNSLASDMHTAYDKKYDFSTRSQALYNEFYRFVDIANGRTNYTLDQNDNAVPTTYAGKRLNHERVKSNHKIDYKWMDDNHWGFRVGFPHDSTHNIVQNVDAHKSSQYQNEKGYRIPFEELSDELTASGKTMPLLNNNRHLDFNQTDARTYYPYTQFNNSDKTVTSTHRSYHGAMDYAGLASITINDQDVITGGNMKIPIMMTSQNKLDFPTSVSQQPFHVTIEQKQFGKMDANDPGYEYNTFKFDHLFNKPLNSVTTTETTYNHGQVNDGDQWDRQVIPQRNVLSHFNPGYALFEFMHTMPFEVNMYLLGESVDAKNAKALAAYDKPWDILQRSTVNITHVAAPPLGLEKYVDYKSYCDVGGFCRTAADNSNRYDYDVYMYGDNSASNLSDTNLTLSRLNLHPTENLNGLVYNPYSQQAKTAHCLTTFGHAVGRSVAFGKGAPKGNTSVAVEPNHVPVPDDKIENFQLLGIFGNTSSSIFQEFQSSYFPPVMYDGTLATASTSGANSLHGMFAFETSILKRNQKYHLVPYDFSRTEIMNTGSAVINSYSSTANRVYQVNVFEPRERIAPKNSQHIMHGFEFVRNVMVTLPENIEDKKVFKKSDKLGFKIEQAIDYNTPPEESDNDIITKSTLATLIPVSGLTGSDYTMHPTTPSGTPKKPYFIVSNMGSAYDVDNVVRDNMIVSILAHHRVVGFGYIPFKKTSTERLKLQIEDRNDPFVLLDARVTQSNVAEKVASTQFGVNRYLQFLPPFDTNPHFKELKNFSDGSKNIQRTEVSTGRHYFMSKRLVDLPPSGSTHFQDVNGNTTKLIKFLPMDPTTDVSDAEYISGETLDSIYDHSTRKVYTDVDSLPRTSEARLPVYVYDFDASTTPVNTMYSNTVYNLQLTSTSGAKPMVAYVDEGSLDVYSLRYDDTDTTKESLDSKLVIREDSHGNAVEFNKSSDIGGDIKEMSLVTRYYTLSDVESRAALSDSNMEYLQTQTKTEKFGVDGNIGKHRFKLHFSGAVRELIWFYRKDSFKMDGELNASNWDFRAYRKSRHDVEYETNISGQTVADIAPGRTASEFDEAVLSTDDDFFSTANLLLNGKPLFTPGRDPLYFSYFNAANYHSRVPIENEYQVFYTMSFGLDPESDTPNGSINLDNFDSVELEFDFPQEIDAGEITVFARVHNVIEVQNGMINHKFSH